MTLAKLPPKHTASHGHCGIAALASLPAAEGTTTAVSSVTGEALQQGEAKYHPSQKRSAGGRSSSRCRSWRGGACVASAACPIRRTAGPSHARQSPTAGRAAVGRVAAGSF